MGSPDFALPVLKALQASDHEITSVYSQPPRRAGRGKALRATPVHQWAEAQGLPVRTPVSLKSEAEQAALHELSIDAAIVVAYGLLLPQKILDIPRLGCLNLHASLLPRWRGAAPIQRAIMAGDTQTGVQVMRMEAGLDTGPVLATKITPITPSDTMADVHDRLAELAAALLLPTLDGLAGGTLTASAQSDQGVSYAHKITAEDQPVDWSRPAAQIDCQIRGLSPSPGAWFHYAGQTGSPAARIKVFFSQAEAGLDGLPAGTVLDDKLLVQCGDGRAVRLLRLQKPGGRPLPAEDFLRGLPVPAGARFS